MNLAYVAGLRDAKGQRPRKTGREALGEMTGGRSRCQTLSEEAPPSDVHPSVEQILILVSGTRTLPAIKEQRAQRR